MYLKVPITILNIINHYVFSVYIIEVYIFVNFAISKKKNRSNLFFVVNQMKISCRVTEDYYLLKYQINKKKMILKSFYLS